MPKIFRITDDNYKKHIKPPKGQQSGLVYRDFATDPVGGRPFTRVYSGRLFSDSEIEERIKLKDREESWINDVRARGNYGKRIPSLSQGEFPFCWGHSTTQGAVVINALQNQPYVPLSAFAVCCLASKFQVRGGYNAESLQVLRDVGVPSQDVWPQGKISRSLDNAQMRADAALRKCLEFYDLESRNARMMATLLLLDIPVMCDFNWWRHSVLAVRLKQWRPKLVITIWNSWSDDWGVYGEGDLEGSRAIADGMTAPSVLKAA